MPKFRFFLPIVFLTLILQFASTAVSSNPSEETESKQKNNSSNPDSLALSNEIDRMLLIWEKDSVQGEAEFQKIFSKISKYKIKGEKLHWYYTLGRKLFYSGHQKAFLKTQQSGLRLAVTLKKGNWKSKFYKNFGDFEKYRDELKISSAYYDTSLMVMDTPDPVYKADLLTTLGRNYYNLAEYKMAMLKYIEAQKIYENYGIKNEAYLDIFHFIGSVFKRLYNNEKALSYYNKMLEISREIHSIDKECEALDLLAGIYSSTDSLQKSFELRHQALKLAKTTDDYELQVLIMLNLADYYQVERKYDEALQLLNEAESIMTKHRSNNNQNRIYLEISKGVILSNTGKPREAISYFESALKLAKGINKKRLLTLSEIYAELADAYSALGDYHSAYNHLLVHMEYQDSLINEKNIKVINELEKKYEAKKKEAEIRMLNLDKTIQKFELEKERLTKNIFIGGFLVTLFLTAFLSYFYYKYRRNNSKQNNEN